MTPMSLMVHGVHEMSVFGFHQAQKKRGWDVLAFGVSFEVGLDGLKLQNPVPIRAGSDH